MEKGQQAKYENEDNEIERNVLLATKDAKLLHYMVSRAKKEDRPPPVVFYDTMRIRHRIKRRQNKFIMYIIYKFMSEGKKVKKR